MKWSKWCEKFLNTFQQFVKHLFYDTSHNSHWKCLKHIPWSQFSIYFKISLVGKFSTQALWNFNKIIKLAMYQTNYVPPNFAYSGGWLLSLASSPPGMYRMCQLPTLSAKSRCFLSWIPCHFMFWFWTIWCRKNTPLTKIGVAKNNIDFNLLNARLGVMHKTIVACVIYQTFKTIKSLLGPLQSNFWNFLRKI